MHRSKSILIDFDWNGMSRARIRRQRCCKALLSPTICYDGVSQVKSYPTILSFNPMCIVCYYLQPHLIVCRAQITVVHIIYLALGTVYRAQIIMVDIACLAHGIVYGAYITMVDIISLQPLRMCIGLRLQLLILYAQPFGLSIGLRVQWVVSCTSPWDCVSGLDYNC